MRPGFWSEAVRIFLVANGRQDLVDRGDALAQRVAALMQSALARLEQYVEDGHLYDGHGGDAHVPDLSSGDPSRLMAAMADIEQFVEVRLRREIAALEQVLSTFDDLQSRDARMPLHELCASLAKSFAKDQSVLDFVQSVDGGGSPCVVALTASDPGLGGHGLRLYGHPFYARRAPRGLRRMAASKVR